MRINLGGYLERIEHSGPLDITSDTLSALCLHHLRTIPFENLDPFFGVAPELALEKIEEKLIVRRRGGYCYEHNLLFADILEEIGFKVDRLIARVRWNIPDEVVTPRSHMLLLAHAQDGDFLVDAGFGSAAPSAALKFVTGVPLETPHELYRLIAKGGEFELQAQAIGGWKPVYRFDLQRQTPTDYEGPNWYSATSPRSHFTYRLIAARIVGDERLVLADNQLTAYRRGRAPARKAIENAAELRAVFRETFGLALPDDEEAGRRLKTIFEETP